MNQRYTRLDDPHSRVSFLVLDGPDRTAPVARDRDGFPALSCSPQRTQVLYVTWTVTGVPPCTGDGGWGEHGLDHEPPRPVP